MKQTSRKQSGAVVAHFPKKKIYTYDCPSCHGLVVNGLCPDCGWNVRCSWCGRLKVAVDSAGHAVFKFFFGQQMDHESSGMCQHCKTNMRSAWIDKSVVESSSSCSSN